MPGTLDALLSMIGRQTQPDLPPVDAMTSDDLTRMEFDALKKKDKDKLQRIADIRNLRAQFGVPGQGPPPVGQPMTAALPQSAPNAGGAGAAIRRAIGIGGLDEVLGGQ